MCQCARWVASSLSFLATTLDSPFESIDSYSLASWRLCEKKILRVRVHPKGDKCMRICPKQAKPIRTVLSRWIPPWQGSMSGRPWPPGLCRRNTPPLRTPGAIRPRSHRSRRRTRWTGDRLRPPRPFRPGTPRRVQGSAWPDDRSRALNSLSPAGERPGRRRVKLTVRHFSLRSK